MKLYQLEELGKWFERNEAKYVWVWLQLLVYSEHG